MNWINFFTWTGIIYALYYLLLIVLDRVRSPAKADQDIQPVLTFSEDHVLETISLADFSSEAPVKEQPEPASKGLGGVSMDTVFDLARNEAFEYTKSVSF